MYSRNVAKVVSILLLVLIFTYRSFEKQYLFYLSWLSGIVICVLFITFFCTRLKVDKVLLKTLFVILPWFLLGGGLTLFAYDKQEHINVLIISTFYMLSSAFISDFLIRSRVSLKQYTFIAFILWVFINFTLLCLFFLDIYVPAKRDFSGVFHDRNVFSITTLLMMAFSYSFLSNFKQSKKTICLFMLCVFLSCLMVLTSKSLTGLLGLFLLILLISFKFSIRNKLLILMLGLFFSFAILFTDNPINDRITRFIMALAGDVDSLRLNESSYIRLYLVNSAIELAKEYPIFGVGINNAKYFIIWPLRDTGSFLHNTYLDILTSGGFPLFLTYYTPLFYSLFWLVNNRKRVKGRLNANNYSLWCCAVSFLSLKLMYDFTWTTYFEFFMVFTVIFSIYVVLHLKRELVRHGICNVCPA